MINLDKSVGFNGETSFNQNISSTSSKASTHDNSNSDVEIIDDDYSNTLQPMSGLNKFKSTIVGHQTTSDSQ